MKGVASSIFNFYCQFLNIEDVIPSSKKFAQVDRLRLRKSMRRACIGILLLWLGTNWCAAFGLQSLAEAARKEAERRQGLDQQNIKVKRIETCDLAQLVSGGTISLSSPRSDAALPLAAAAKPPPRPTLRSFQTRLQKLDRDILQAEDRLKQLRARAEAERWSPAKPAKGSMGFVQSSSSMQLASQIQELEAKLVRLHMDRSNTFQDGRKAGFLPGELENRGVIR
jgi:hypothetical protein